MPRQDDPSIDGDLVLLRRIPYYPDNVSWLEEGPRPSSLNFKDRSLELSMHIESETTHAAIMGGHDGFGLIRLTAGVIREICAGSIGLCRDDIDPTEGHVLVCGKLTCGMLKRLSQ